MEGFPTLAITSITGSHGASAVVMAGAYPNSHFWGFDYHEPSIEIARQ